MNRLFRSPREVLHEEITSHIALTNFCFLIKVPAIFRSWRNFLAKTWKEIRIFLCNLSFVMGREIYFVLWHECEDGEGSIIEDVVAKAQRSNVILYYSISRLQPSLTFRSFQWLPVDGRRYFKTIPSWQPTQDENFYFINKKKD